MGRAGQGRGVVAADRVAQSGGVIVAVIAQQHCSRRAWPLRTEARSRRDGDAETRATQNKRETQERTVKDRRNEQERTTTDRREKDRTRTDRKVH